MQLSRDTLLISIFKFPWHYIVMVGEKNIPNNPKQILTQNHTPKGASN